VNLSPLYSILFFISNQKYFFKKRENWLEKGKEKNVAMKRSCLREKKILHG
jgi:hypothetical protein